MYVQIAFEKRTPDVLRVIKMHEYCILHCLHKSTSLAYWRPCNLALIINLYIYLNISDDIFTKFNIVIHTNF